MPHIAVTMYPGRDNATKQALALKLQQAVADELKLDKQHITVSIEDIERDQWEAHIKKIPQSAMFIKKDA